MTRRRLLEAAITTFAERGYAGASVRLICRRAKANPAAIKYHFGGKEELYREVLRAAAAAFGAQQGPAEEEFDRLEPADAVALLMRRQLAPLLRRDKAGRYLRIFAWENMAPTPTFRSFIASEPIPILSMAEDVVRKLLPAQATAEEITVATVWLVNQPAPFIRNRETLSGPPFNLKFDQPFLDRLADSLARLAVGGLRASREDGQDRERTPSAEPALGAA